MDASESTGRDDLTTEEAFGVVDALRGAGHPLLILSGGEPLLRDDLEAIAGRAAAAGMPVALGTSGILLTHERAQRLRRAGVTAAAISLDSTDPHQHDAFRGAPGAFAGALAGMDACQEAGIRVQANVTVTPDNLDEVESVLSLAAGHGATSAQVFCFVPTGRAKDWVGPDEYEALLARLLGRVEELPLPVRPTCAPQFIRIADELGVTRPGWQRGCLAGVAYCRVAPNGDLTPCPYLPVAVGSLLSEPFATLWQDAPVFAALRDPERLHGACGACEYRARCGGCRARAYAVSGDLLGPEPLCPHVPGAGRAA
jgi:radical SAM protein with 4Fe4S-binding SPASM domain